MEITPLAGLLSVLMLTACHGAGQPRPVDQNGVPTKWTFNFFTPQALPALVTYACVQDADGKMYVFHTLDSTKALYGVVGKWDDHSRALNGYWNHVERPPRHIIFCWDSVIDKKMYETHLSIPQPVLEKMLRPSM